MPIPLNGPAPLQYRIGTSDRPLGQPTSDPDGFLVLNTTTSQVFKAQGGVWVDGGTFDTTLLAAWYASTVAHAAPGKGYRIGTTDRPIGGHTGAPDGFLVLNTTNSSVFAASSGVWTSAGSFPADLLAAWLAA
jgi:hypothetical protein